MDNEETYTPQRVAQIQRAYQAIFPKITPELADYWGLERERPWSCLTTNFHDATFAKLESLHQRAREIDRMGLTFDAKGRVLREAALALGVGYSIGISPWTDNLLARTYADDKDSVVILLGHDWYPIVPDERPAGTPLTATDSLHGVERYWPGAPEAVLAGSTVGLFVNLYPDYRPPGDPKCGSLHKYGYSYAQCLAGLDAMMVEVSKRFSQVQLVSWGSNVWTALSPRVHSGRSGILLSEHVRQAPGSVLTIELGGQEVPYLPLMHPGHWGNFGRSYHLRHVKAGYAAMQLGLPGLATSTTGRARSARHIAID
jgi:hypothetical protein